MLADRVETTIVVIIEIVKADHVEIVTVKMNTIVRNSEYLAMYRVFFSLTTSGYWINKFKSISEITAIETDTDPIETGIQMMISIVIDTDQKGGTNISDAF